MNEFGFPTVVNCRIDRYEQKLFNLGVTNAHFTHHRKFPFVDFSCSGQHIRCIYRSEYGDPNDWNALKFDENLINQNTFDFIWSRETIIRFYGVAIYRCFPVMAFTYEIALNLRRWQIEVHYARKKIVDLVESCATFQRASELLSKNQELCCNARWSRRSWGFVWSLVKRRRNVRVERLRVVFSPPIQNYALSTTESL
jgi:hypothetical protein